MKSSQRRSREDSFLYGSKFIQFRRNDPGDVAGYDDLSQSGGDTLRGWSWRLALVYEIRRSRARSGGRAQRASECVCKREKQPSVTPSRCEGGYKELALRFSRAISCFIFYFFNLLLLSVFVLPLVRGAGERRWTVTCRESRLQSSDAWDPGSRTLNFWAVPCVPPQSSLVVLIWKFGGVGVVLYMQYRFFFPIVNVSSWFLGILVRKWLLRGRWHS